MRYATQDSISSSPRILYSATSLHSSNRTAEWWHRRARHCRSLKLTLTKKRAWRSVDGQVNIVRCTWIKLRDSTSWRSSRIKNLLKTVRWPMMSIGLTLWSLSRSSCTMIRRWTNKGQLSKASPERKQRNNRHWSNSRSSSIWKRTKSSRICLIQVRLEWMLLRMKSKSLKTSRVPLQITYRKGQLLTLKWKWSRTMSEKHLVKKVVLKKYRSHWALSVAQIASS